MNFRRLFDILPYQQAKYPQKVALSSRTQDGWRTYSTRSCLELVEQLSVGLLRSGFKKGDKVAILSHCGSPAWNLTDLALQQIGAVVIPIHYTSSSQDIAYILQEAQIRTCFISNGELAAKAGSLTESQSELIAFEKIPGFKYWRDLLVDPTEAEISQLGEIKEGITPTDLATIIYTSGTAGDPKGVMLSHRNIVSNIKAIMTLVPVNNSTNAISFLPLSHIFERMVIFLYMAAGASVWYSESAEKVFEDVHDVRPNFMTAVPRILEKMYESLMTSQQQQGAWGRKLIDWAIKLGENYDPMEKLSPVFWLRHRLLDLLVYRQWRRALGGNIDGIVVGAAALQPRLAALFCSAGIPVREGYGLTETSPVVSFNHFEPGLFKFGTVGIPVPGVEVRIDMPDEDGDGEILVRGPNVMMGYYNQPERTTAVLSSDGWLRTGDVGHYVNRRFLKITDRKRDIFKTSSGKYVAPQKVENHLKNSPYIVQAMVMGLNQPSVSALIVPDFIALEAYCNANNIHWTAPQYMALNPKVIQFMQGVIDELNGSLEPHECVHHFLLLHEEWSVENGGLTFTQKLDRNYLKEKFTKEIAGMSVV